jgi:phosphatidate cytidylyltransferase
MLKYRLITGILMAVSLILAAIYLPPIGVWFVLMAISSFAQYEFYTMANLAGIPAFRMVGILCGGSMITATFLTIGPSAEEMAEAYRWEQLVLIGTLIAVFLRQFPQKHNDKPIATIACTLLGIWYVPYLFNFFTWLVYAWHSAGLSAHVSETGRLLVFYLVLVVKMTDTGAYMVGSLIGRHKLIPRISPGKTWEGFFGGIAFGVIASCGFAWVVHFKMGQLQFPMIHAVMLGVVLALCGTAGDLFESLLKRSAGAKDSGRVLPGMGGLLDVLDSLLFGAPALYVYARLVLA